ncbi:helix-turn-helix transcriptional regulator [Nocardiopsis sp. RSe5-2]|uniref:Helix-turn-helix transcriptional regulator n=1 Tax=Nocardiopsis endophytica TaxID=3018445 RepID=A0ABT4U1H1_9ACTN|nr:helix-turn-helix transcriptional regulator [Nocardiopsis endophytica]MDA2810320.1 helix-turn-helix transcriptional regulator [Nocardiopsis endophytica]
MAADENPTIAQWQLARALTDLRGRIAQRRLAKDLDVDASTLVRWEKGETVPRERQLRKVLTYFEVPEAEAERLVALRAEAAVPVWWQETDVARAYGQYIDLENSASQISTYQDRLVPGLLQTADYARAILAAGHPRATEEELDGLQQVRMRRQDNWEAGESLLWAIIDQAALEKHIGGPAVMHAQVQHLISMTKHPRIDLQVLPNSAGAHAALQTGSFVLLELEKPSMQVIYIEAHTRNLLLDDHKEVTAHRRLLDHLRAAGANTPQTRDLLNDLMKRYEGRSS